MTIGISKDDLLEIDPWQHDNQQDLLNAILDQCTELNPWLPIEQAPKDRKVFLAFPMQDGSYEYDAAFAFGTAIVRDWNAKGMPAIKPTHYQELPEPPK